MENPTCPICGSPTKLQTAKKGRFTGQQFYGCIRYPKCKGLINISDNQNDNSNNISNNGNLTKEKLSLPRNFIARPRINGYQLRFFESVSVSELILDKILENDVQDDIKKIFSQWRIDYPVPQNPPSFNENEKQIVSVIEKILTRGSLTLSSPFLEEKFHKRFEQNVESMNIEGLNKIFISTSYFLNDLNYWLDSPAEEIFYKKYLPEKFGKEFLKWVSPQVEIASLITDTNLVQYSGRVDFLICIPYSGSLIVEIDGAIHKKQIDLDRSRDNALVNEGFKIIRIPSSEIEELHGNKLNELENFISENFEHSKYLQQNKLFRFVHSLKIAHQIQLTILQAIKSGLLPLFDSSAWKISLDLDSNGLFSNRDSDFILKSAISDLISLLNNFTKLYNIKINSVENNTFKDSKEKEIRISYTGIVNSSIPTFIIQNISLPFNIANNIFLSEPVKNILPSPDVLEFFLNYIFRKPSFWEGQLDAISRALQGKDSIVLLPTGAGKSIAFQLASFLLPGRTIVIDPIISLMDDQIDNLQSIGIDRVVAITSELTDPLSRTKILELFGQGEYLFAYIAPERFQTIEFRKSLRVLTTHTPISLIAVDEAHCVSEWGHEFRTAYLNIGRTSRTYCAFNNIIPPLLALTGTASQAVLKDIERELQIDDFDAIITPKSFDRVELKFHVVSSTSAEKSAKLMGYLGQTLPHEFTVPASSFFQSNSKATYSGLIFCPHVNGDFGIVEISKKITGTLQISTGIYSGKEPKFYSGQVWGFEKKSIAKQFKSNHLPLLICTKAFGMGIDKPNIRYTFHFGIPPSIESFYQEAGRAGRDRKIAHCIILVSVDDPERAKKLLDPNTSPEDISSIIKDIKWEDNDDVTRALFFQTRSFPGIDKEISKVELVINPFPELFKKVTKIN